MLSPASIFTIIWIVMILVFLIFDDRQYPYWGIVWLLAGVILVNAGQSFALRKQKKRLLGVKEVKTRYSSNFICKKIILIVICSFLIVYNIFNYFRNGGVGNIASTAYDYYTSENTDTSLVTSLLVQVSSFMMYISGFLGGCVFRISKKKKNKLISLLPFVAPIIMMLTSSGKLGLIVVVITFIIGYIVESLNRRTDFRTRTFFRLLKKYWIFIPVFIMLFALTLALRMGTISAHTLTIAFNKLKSYAFGSPAAFNAWFSSGNSFELGFGKNTFTGVLNALGLAKREQGVYRISVTTDVWSTNVYTAFRGIIEDFGYFGGLVFLFILGFIFGKSYKIYIKRRKRLAFWFLTNSYLFVFYSIIISPFIYLNLSALFLLYLLFQFVIQLCIRYFKKGEHRNERHYLSRGQRDPSLSANNSN